MFSSNSNTPSLGMSFVEVARDTRSSEEMMTSFLALFHTTQQNELTQLPTLIEEFKTKNPKLPFDFLLPENIETLKQYVKAYLQIDNYLSPEEKNHLNQAIQIKNRGYSSYTDEEMKVLIKAIRINNGRPKYREAIAELNSGQLFNQLKENYASYPDTLNSIDIIEANWNKRKQFAFQTIEALIKLGNILELIHGYVKKISEALTYETGYLALGLGKKLTVTDKAVLLNLFHSVETILNNELKQLSDAVLQRLSLIDRDNLSTADDDVVLQTMTELKMFGLKNQKVEAFKNQRFPRPAITEKMLNSLNKFITTFGTDAQRKLLTELYNAKKNETVFVPLDISNQFYMTSNDDLTGSFIAIQPLTSSITGGNNGWRVEQELLDDFVIIPQNSTTCEIESFFYIVKDETNRLIEEAAENWFSTNKYRELFKNNVTSKLFAKNESDISNILVEAYQTSVVAIMQNQIIQFECTLEFDQAYIDLVMDLLQKNDKKKPFEDILTLAKETAAKTTANLSFVNTVLLQKNGRAYKEDFARQVIDKVKDGEEVTSAISRTKKEMVVNYHASYYATPKNQKIFSDVLSNRLSKIEETDYAWGNALAEANQCMQDKEELVALLTNDFHQLQTRRNSVLRLFTSTNKIEETLLQLTKTISDIKDCRSIEELHNHVRSLQSMKITQSSYINDFFLLKEAKKSGWVEKNILSINI